ncbi:MAG TPA: hypothetical protein VIY56_19420 [Vicinamibacterales bacterium]
MDAGYRTRLVSAAVVLVAVAALTWLALSLARPQSPVTVNVRWTAEVSPAQRVELEQRFQLTGGTLDGGTTWTYRLTDPSTANIRALVRHQAVDDTAHLNRVRFRPELSQDRALHAVLAAAGSGAIGAVAWLLLSAGRGRRADARTDPGPLVRLTDEELRAVTEAHPDRRRELAWFAAVLALSMPLLFALCAAMWNSPYPISETVGILEDAGSSPNSFFDPRVRSWYRPLFHLTFYTFWRGTGSLDSAMVLFKVLEVTSVAALVVLFIWQLRPRTPFEGAAATFAVAVLVGTPGFRDNLELPLLMTLVGMPLILIAWMLLEHDHRAWHAPAIVGLLLLAVGFKEQGLVIAPLVVVAWWAGAPGARRSTAVTVAVVTVLYLAMRFGIKGSWKSFEQGVALGFDVISSSDAIDRFGSFPWPMYAYNAVATVANILLSEPSAGRFRITFDLIQGQLEPWEVNHVVSSAALTALVAWWGLRVWKREAGGPWSLELRVFAATIVTLAASGALGFNYARDRLGGMAVVFYAMAAYFAMRAAGRRAVLAPSGRMVATCGALVLLAGAWQVRAIGTLEDVRVRSENTQREWLTDLQRRRVERADRPTYLRILNDMVDQGLDPSLAQRTSYPDWIVALLGER